MMEGRAGDFPAALKARLTRVQESCTLPKGFSDAAYEAPNRRQTISLFLFAAFNFRSSISHEICCEV